MNHEAGHGYGLLHDGGDNGGEYFNGFSSFQWTPLMGNVWPGDRWAQALFQFSKGEYTSATRKEDDFALINRHMEFVADDIPDTTPLLLTGTTVSPTTNWGQIHKNTDTDSWSFQVAAGGGKATLKIDRIEDKGGSMLDIDASILDSTGKAVAQNNADVARSASLNVDLPAGSYTLLIKGGSEGTPSKGFSNYSSVGLYSIDGSITGGMSTGGTGGTGGAGGMGGMGGAAAGAAGAATRGGTAGASSSGGASGSSSRGGAAGSSSGGVGGMTASAGKSGGGGTTASAGNAGTAGTSGGSGGSLTGSGGSTGGSPTGSGGATATGGTATGASTGTGGFVGSGGAVPGTGGTPSQGGAMAPTTGSPAEPSGCACTTAGGKQKFGASSTSLAGLALALFSLRRRRRR
jgi:hypothetical protein